MGKKNEGLVMDELQTYGGRDGARLAAISIKHGTKQGDDTFDALAVLELEGNEALKELYEADPDKWQLGAEATGSAKSKTEEMGY